MATDPDGTLLCRLCVNIPAELRNSIYQHIIDSKPLVVSAPSFETLSVPGQLIRPLEKMQREFASLLLSNVSIRVTTLADFWCLENFVYHLIESRETKDILTSLEFPRFWDIASSPSRSLDIMSFLHGMESFSGRELVKGLEFPRFWELASSETKTREILDICVDLSNLEHLSISLHVRHVMSHSAVHNEVQNTDDLRTAEMIATTYQLARLLEMPSLETIKLMLVSGGDVTVPSNGNESIDQRETNQNDTVGRIGDTITPFHLTAMEFPNFCGMASSEMKTQEIMDFCTELPNLQTLTISLDLRYLTTPTLHNGFMNDNHTDPGMTTEKAVANYQLTRLTKMPALTKITMIITAGGGDIKESSSAGSSLEDAAATQSDVAKLLEETMDLFPLMVVFLQRCFTSAEGVIKVEDTYHTPSTMNGVMACTLNIKRS